MAKKFNLADYVQPSPVPESGTAPEIVMLPLSRIRPNGKNFYRVDGIEELAESIQLNGLLQPLVVFRRDGAYVLLSGHRRYQALRWLYDSGGKEWAEAPCVVCGEPQDAVREELALIHANSTGRVLTGPETAEQARHIKAALLALQEQGVELPGRMRDYVAREMGVSKSKLSRVEAIEKRLQHADWKNVWISGALTESAAYRLSQLPRTDQALLWNHYQSAGIPVNRVTAKDIDRILSALRGGGDAPPASAGTVAGTVTEALPAAPAAEEAVNAAALLIAPAWQTGDAPGDGRYLCLVSVCGDPVSSALHEQRLDRREGRWYAYGREIDAYGMTVRAWWPLPPKWHSWDRLENEGEQEDDNDD